MSNARTIQGQRPRRSINSPGGSLLQRCLTPKSAPRPGGPPPGNSTGPTDHRDDPERNYLDEYAAGSPGKRAWGRDNEALLFQRSTLL
jgi:hypothetical protein